MIKWESGVSEPSVEKLKQLADLFDVTMDEVSDTDFEEQTSPRSGQAGPIIKKKLFVYMP